MQKVSIRFTYVTFVILMLHCDRSMIQELYESTEYSAVTINETWQVRKMMPCINYHLDLSGSHNRIQSLIATIG